MFRQLQRSFGNAQQGFDDDNQHSGLDAEEQRFDDRHLAESCIDHRQAQNHESAGQDKQKARGKPPLEAMHAPAGIGCELHRFWSRQQHAKAQRVEILLLGEPLFLVDDNAVHQRNLCRWAAEGEDADPRPNPKRFGESGLARNVWFRIGFDFGHRFSSVSSANRSIIVSNVQSSPRRLQKTSFTSNGVASNFSATFITSGGATNKKCAFGSTKRRMSQGHAMRSIFWPVPRDPNGTALRIARRAAIALAPFDAFGLHAFHR